VIESRPNLFKRGIFLLVARRREHKEFAEHRVSEQFLVWA